jgi:hypothetical protein
MIHEHNEDIECANLEKILSISESIVSAYLPLCVYTQIGGGEERELNGRHRKEIAKCRAHGFYWLKTMKYYVN